MTEEKLKVDTQKTEITMWSEKKSLILEAIF